MDSNCKDAVIKYPGYLADHYNHRTNTVYVFENDWHKMLGNDGFGNAEELGWNKTVVSLDGTWHHLKKVSEPTDDVEYLEWILERPIQNAMDETVHKYYHVEFIDHETYIKEE